jgi:cytochrome c556
MSIEPRHGLATVLLVALAGGSALSADPSTDAIEERQQAMKDVGAAMQNLAAIAKKEAPFDAGVVESNAATIAEGLKRAAGLFPAGSDQGEGETWAQPEVWSLGNACKACHQTYRRPKE